jgi:hypothetical protein
MADQQPGRRKPGKSAATRLVEIAEDLYEFGCVAEQRGGVSGNPVSDPVAVFAYARPKANPAARRPLEDIRPDIAAVYMASHGAAPSPAALGNAMTILLGKARQADPDPPDPVDELLAAHGLARIPADRGLSLVTGQTGCPLPEGYVIPEPYLVAPDGLYLVRADGTERMRVTWAWLFPVRVYVDPDGDHLVELAWRDDHRWVTRLTRRSLTKGGRKLITEVGDAGLPVIARQPVARQLGWQADGKTFVTGQDAPWRVEPRYSDQVAALAAHRPYGTLAAWKDAIAAARDHLIVQVGAYAGLASPAASPARARLVHRRLLWQVNTRQDHHGDGRAELLG